MMFTIVPIFILVVGAFVFFGVIQTFLRNRRMMDNVTDEIFRQARTRDRKVDSVSGNAASAPAGDYSCDNCGASLGSDTEISPSGDFKCQYCDSWSNVNS